MPPEAGLLQGTSSRTFSTCFWTLFFGKGLCPLIWRNASSPPSSAYRDVWRPWSGRAARIHRPSLILSLDSSSRLSATAERKWMSYSIYRTMALARSGKRNHKSVLILQPPAALTSCRTCSFHRPIAMI
jgi:hypothetical protein